ncbi:hypothetical protein [Yersinia bercovieri]|uniref:hypothetical protein n=1 Tax=Yersinia bercovieri TaxID=634 RepID=UPI00119D0CA8|nr:hypothetical protein [Yersinia bercovieri]
MAKHVKVTLDGGKEHIASVEYELGNSHLKEIPDPHYRFYMPQSFDSFCEDIEVPFRDILNFEHEIGQNFFGKNYDELCSEIKKKLSEEDDYLDVLSTETKTDFRAFLPYTLALLILAKMAHSSGATANAWSFLTYAAYFYGQFSSLFRRISVIPTEKKPSVHLDFLPAKKMPERPQTFDNACVLFDQLYIECLTAFNSAEANFKQAVIECSDHLPLSIEPTKSKREQKKATEAAKDSRNNHYNSLSIGEYYKSLKNLIEYQMNRDLTEINIKTDEFIDMTSLAYFPKALMYYYQARMDCPEEFVNDAWATLVEAYLCLGILTGAYLNQHYFIDRKSRITEAKSRGAKEREAAKSGRIVQKKIVELLNQKSPSENWITKADAINSIIPETTDFIKINDIKYISSHTLKERIRIWSKEGILKDAFELHIKK